MNKKRLIGDLETVKSLMELNQVDEATELLETIIEEIKLSDTK